MTLFKSPWWKSLAFEGRSVGWSQSKTGSKNQGASVFIHQEIDELCRCKGKGPISVSFENLMKVLESFPEKTYIYIKYISFQRALGFLSIVLCS